MSNLVEVPWQQVSAEALDRLIEEFVTRDGTDYGAVETTLETRLARVRQQLERGDIVLIYDTYLESAQFVLAHEWKNSIEGA